MIDEVRTGTYRQLFHPGKQLLAVCLFMRGYALHAAIAEDCRFNFACLCGTQSS